MAGNAEPVRDRMTVDEFLRWAAEQPGRHELVGGEVVAMAPERNRHLLAKKRVDQALDRAIAEARLDCQALPDGATLRIDEATAYVPDALVICGPIDLDSVEVEDPVVVVEVLSPSSRGVDAGAKLTDYFRLASVRHYLLVDPERRVVVHHGRAEDGSIATHVRRDGTFRMDPPGLSVAVEDLFPLGRVEP